MNTTRRRPPRLLIIWSKSADVMGPLVPSATTTTAGRLPAAFMEANRRSPAAHWRLTAALTTTPRALSVLGAYSATSSSTESPTAMAPPGTGVGGAVTAVVGGGTVVAGTWAAAAEAVGAVVAGTVGAGTAEDVDAARPAGPPAFVSAGGAAPVVPWAQPTGPGRTPRSDGARSTTNARRMRPD